MRKVSEIEAELRPLQAELYKIRDAERTSKHRALIGKCYKYLNSYGGDRPKWWLYLVVTATGGYYPKGISFQTTSSRETIIKLEDLLTGVGQSSEYIEIPRKELLSAWKETLKRINGLKP